MQRHLGRAAWFLAVAAAALVVGALAGCGSPPGGPVDGASDNFAWDIDVSGLSEAVLSTCAGAGGVYAVGGRDDRAFVLEWTGTEWLAPVLPSSAGVLWWCWVASDGTAWAVGEHGTVLTRSTGLWRAEDPGTIVDTDTTLYGVWGATPDLVHIVGGRQVGVETNAVILEYDDGTWTAVDSSTLPEQVLFKVWGASAFDVWAVGEAGVIVRRETSAAWSVEPSTTDDRLISVWGSDADDVYAVGGAGTGLVLRYDGVAWSSFATTPEPLSGVWTAPNQPLYVAGNRGYLARYDRLGAAVPTNPSVALPVDDLCFHALIGVDDAVLATASDLFGGGATSWRGAILSHGGDFDGPVTRLMPPDAGTPSDAAPIDATPSDAGPPDAGWPGPADECGMVPAICADGLECWQLAIESFVFICTQPCTDASECTADYGAGACCERPGIQTLETVCIPGSYAECNQ